MDIRLPRLGEGTDSGTVASIFVKEGDRLTKDQAILELESEKAVASIPSPAGGVVSKIHVKEGDVVKVGQLLVSVNDGSGVTPDQPSMETRGDEEPAPSPQPGHSGVPQAAAPVRMEAAALAPVSGPLPPASPTIRKVARDLGIDLRRVKGSEAGGRVVLEDLRRYVQWLQEMALQPPPKTGAGPAPAVPAPVIDFSRWGPVRTSRITTLRKTISTKMVEAWTRVPHVTQFDEADISGILALRKKYSKAYEKQGVRLTLTSFALRAVVNALRKHPVFNASIQEATGEIVYKEYFHIGLAVDTDFGLLVPVIREVDKKTLVQLSADIQLLADRARERKLAIEEMQGGTFSISNQGGIGGGFFTPIINTPEVAILGMGRGVARPVVREGKIVERSLLPLGLSYDHRLVDGANAARFIVDLVSEFEQFSEDDVKI